MDAFIDDISLLAKRPASWPMSTTIPLPEYENFTYMKSEGEDASAFQLVEKFQNLFLELMKFKTTDKSAKPTTLDTAINLETDAESINDFFHVPESYKDLQSYSKQSYQTSKLAEKGTIDASIFSSSKANLDGVKDYSQLQVSKSNAKDAAVLATESLLRANQAFDAVQKTDISKADVHNRASMGWVTGQRQDIKKGLDAFTQGPASQIIKILGDSKDDKDKNLLAAFQGNLNKLNQLYAGEMKELTKTMDKYHADEIGRFSGRITQKSSGKKDWSRKKSEYADEKETSQIDKRRLERLAAKTRSKRRADNKRLQKKRG